MTFKTTNPPLVGWCRSGYDPDLYLWRGAMIRTIEDSWLSSVFPDRWWNSISACQQTATTCCQSCI